MLLIEKLCINKYSMVYGIDIVGVLIVIIKDRNKFECKDQFK